MLICSEIESSCLCLKTSIIIFSTFPPSIIVYLLFIVPIMSFHPCLMKAKNKIYIIEEIMEKTAKEISLSSHQNHPITLWEKVFFTFIFPPPARCLLRVKKIWKLLLSPKITARILKMFYFSLPRVRIVSRMSEHARTYSNNASNFIQSNFNQHHRHYQCTKSLKSTLKKCEIQKVPITCHPCNNKLRSTARSHITASPAWKSRKRQQRSRRKIPRHFKSSEV